MCRPRLPVLSALVSVAIVFCGTDRVLASPTGQPARIESAEHTWMAVKAAHLATEAGYVSIATAGMGRVSIPAAPAGCFSTGASIYVARCGSIGSSTCTTVTGSCGLAGRTTGVRCVCIGFLGPDMPIAMISGVSVQAAHSVAATYIAPRPSTAASGYGPVGSVARSPPDPRIWLRE